MKLKLKLFNLRSYYEMVVLPRDGPTNNYAAVHWVHFGALKVPLCNGNPQFD